MTKKDILKKAEEKYPTPPRECFPDDKEYSLACWIQIAKSGAYAQALKDCALTWKDADLFIMAIMEHFGIFISRTNEECADVLKIYERMKKESDGIE